MSATRVRAAEVVAAAVVVAAATAPARAPWRRIAAAAMTVLALAGAPAAAAPPGPMQAPQRVVPQQVALWLSVPPVDGDLGACAVDGPARQWRLAAGDARLSPDRGGYRLQQLGADAGRDDGWTQRCFQLRDGSRVLLQGAVVPAMSARLLSPPLWVAVLENRARYVPQMTVGCGYPGFGQAPAGCGPGLKPAPMP